MVDYSYLIPAWLRGTPLGDIWQEAYIQTGDGSAALEAVRTDAEYDLVFAGNKREDGSIRYDENTYLSTMESYADSIESIGLNAALFADKFVQLIEGDVSGPEFWQDRVKPIYDRVIKNTAAVQKEYADAFGIAMTREAILASVLDPDGLGAGILEETISMSELKGEYSSRFDASPDMMGDDYFKELDEYGVDQGFSRQLFANAEVMVPAIAALAARHADPDDSFDLAEFTSATVYGDPFEASRMRRLMAQERASFQQASSQLDIVRNRITGASGLQER